MNESIVEKGSESGNLNDVARPLLKTASTSASRRGYSVSDVICIAPPFGTVDSLPRVKERKQIFRLLSSQAQVPQKQHLQALPNLLNQHPSSQIDSDYYGKAVYRLPRKREQFCRARKRVSERVGRRGREIGKVMAVMGMAAP